MPAEVIRIFSDLHFGDHSSRIARPEALAPLVEGADRWIINGDSLDTRPGPSLQYNADNRARLDAGLRALGIPLTQLTGNHDPDISDCHALELANGRVFLTHGDILYPDIVPWGRDVRRIRQRFAEVRAASPAATSLGDELRILRTVAASIPQRHQAERNRIKYLAQLATDLMWPPWRSAAIFQAWFSLPGRTRAFARRYGLRPQVILTGHTHWRGIWRRPGEPVIVNTGCFCRPFRGLLADLRGDRLEIRRIAPRGSEFHAGPRVAELRLGDPAR